MKELRKLGLNSEWVRASAFYARSPWWNAKASQMNAALPGEWFREQKLVFMIEVIQSAQKQANV